MYYGNCECKFFGGGRAPAIDWSWTGTSPQRQTCSFHELRASGPNFWMEHNGATKFSGKVSPSGTLNAHPLYMIFLPKSFTWCAKSCHSVRWQERNQVGNLGHLSFQKWRFLDISCVCVVCVFFQLCHCVIANHFHRKQSSSGTLSQPEVSLIDAMDWQE